MENRMQVILADSSQTDSTHSTRIKVKIDGGPYLQVQYNIVRSLAVHMVFGMSFLWCTNSQIDWKTHIVKFGDEKCTQTVPVALGDGRLFLTEILAKTAVRLAKQQGSEAWLTLIRGPQNR